jgi:acyl-CoA reductase-like NAD-dependent aldehyde dehydrogenase
MIEISAEAEDHGLAMLRIDGLSRADLLRHRAYVYGSGLRNVMRVAGTLDHGTVAANTPKSTGPPVPFGGTKQSGLGREGSRHGLEDCSKLEHLCLGGLA